MRKTKKSHSKKFIFRSLFDLSMSSQNKRNQEIEDKKLNKNNH